MPALGQAGWGARDLRATHCATLEPGNIPIPCIVLAFLLRHFGRDLLDPRTVVSHPRLWFGARGLDWMPPNNIYWPIPNLRVYKKCHPLNTESSARAQLPYTLTTQVREGDVHDACCAVAHHYCYGRTAGRAAPARQVPKLAVHRRV